MLRMSRLGYKLEMESMSLMLVALELPLMCRTMLLRALPGPTSMKLEIPEPTM